MFDEAIFPMYSMAGTALFAISSPQDELNHYSLMFVREYLISALHARAATDTDTTLPANRK
jgi:hypothetical protein